MTIRRLGLVLLFAAVWLCQNAAAQVGLGGGSLGGAGGGMPVVTSPLSGGASGAAGVDLGSSTARPTIINRGAASSGQEEKREPAPPPPPGPEQRNEFQDFVGVSLGRTLPVFGYSLFQSPPSTFAPLDHIPVTPDYVLGPGDEVIIRAWGQVDIDYRTVVDRNGAIHVPQIGTLTVGGLRYQDLHNFVRASISRVYRNFELSVMLGQLRSIQIFVVGQAKRPGAYTVSSLSTLVNALFASGGPSSKGSMRRIELKRHDQVVSEFDVYDLLLRGDKSKDARLLPGDVIYIPPIGDLVAIAGSVNQPAIYELKGETKLSDVIAMAGGLSTVAAGQKVTLERIFERRVRRVDEFPLDSTGLARTLRDGDLVQVEAVSPRFENAVTLRGAVKTPRRFPWTEGMRVKDLIPDRESLIVPDYWAKLNLAPRRELAPEQRMSADQQRMALEEMRSRQVQQRARLEDLNTRDPRAQASPTSEDPRALAAAQQSDDLKARSEGWAPTDELRFRAEIKQRFDEINWDYAIIERLNYSDLSTQLIPFNLGRAVLEGDPADNLLLRPGDVITIFSRVDIQVPVAKQTKFVRLEGEIAVPGVYQALPGETLRQLLTRVGGFTRNAYLYGAEFTRQAVRIQQQKRLDELTDRLAQEIERTASNRAQAASDPPESITAQVESQRRLVARMREVRATGRIVLEIDPKASDLREVPEIPLEDGDRFLIPVRPATVGVLGSVYNQATFVYKPEKGLGDYLEQAGGPTRSADKSHIYVVRADGSVDGKARASIFGRSERMWPGDTVVVPENLDRFVLSKALRDWTQIFSQFALGVAALKVLRDF